MFYHSCLWWMFGAAVIIRGSPLRAGLCQREMGWCLDPEWLPSQPALPAGWLSPYLPAPISSLNLPKGFPRLHPTHSVHSSGVNWKPIEVRKCEKDRTIFSQRDNLVARSTCLLGFQCTQFVNFSLSLSYYRASQAPNFVWKLVILSNRDGISYKIS